jgi:uncharacterized membrane protein
MTDVAMAVPGAFRLGDVFSKALTIYGRRFASFIILTVIAAIPQYVTLYVIDAATLGPFGTGRVVQYVVNLACSSIASGAVIYGVVQELRGRAFSVADSLQIALNRLLPMIGVAICTSILIFLATILLIVPGLMVACAFYVSMPACVAENAGVFESMARSRFLTKGYRWQVFGLFLLILVAGILLGALAAMAFVFTSRVGLLVATQAIGAVVGSFNGVIVGVVYYQLRVAKEGVDINKIASVFD